MRWTPKQYAEHIHKASQRIYRDSGKASGAKPESAVLNEPLAKACGEESYPTRFAISIVSFRTRLCDPDNLVGKYFVDALRYEELVPDDTAEIVDYHISQRKVKTKQEERTEITITPL